MILSRIMPSYLVALLVAIVAMFAVACGGDDEPTAAPPTGATAAPAPTSAPAPAATTAASQPTATLAAGAFRPTPTVEGAAPAPTPAPTDPPAMAIEPKVETLVIAVDPGTGETMLPWGGTAEHIQQMDLVMEFLIDIDPKTNTWVPELAKSWELSEDGKEWTFVLEEGIQWHDGWGEFTADDVLHSVTMQGRDDSLLAYANDYRNIDLTTSEKVSDHEVILKLKNPNPDYLFYLAPSGAGVMMSKAQWDSGGDAAYEEDMIGTGPYRFTGRELGVNFTYERLDDHWRRNNPPPDWLMVDLRWMPEVSARNAGLLAEEVHVTDLTRELADAAVADYGMKIIESQHPSYQVNGVFQGIYPEEADTWGPGYMYPDLPYMDVRVREAMNRAMDKELIKNTLFSGRAIPSPHVGFFQNLPGWSPRWLEEYDEKYGYDPDLARELLAEAGYPDGFDMRGVLMPVAGFPEALDLMEAVASMLGDVGINVQLEEWEFSNYIASWTAKEPESLGLWIAPPSYKTVYASLSLFNRSSGNIHFFENPELDDLFAQLDVSADSAERDRLQREMGDILHDEYAYLNFFYINIEMLVNPNIVDSWEYPGSDGSNYGHFDLIRACVTEDPCYN